MSRSQSQVPQEWIDKTRQMLLKIESNTFYARTDKWNELVNEQTLALQIELFGRPTTNIQFQCILSDKDLKESTKYLHSWPGLDLNKSCQSNMPKTLEHYQAKAKNWLNGRRAKECSRTLFPLLIVRAEEVMIVHKKKHVNMYIQHNVLP